MPTTSYPREELRAKLAGLGVPATMHEVSVLRALVPARLDPSRLEKYEADVLAEILFYLIDRNILAAPDGDVYELGWGEHGCLLYRSSAERLEFLASYFTAGLQNDEYCVWAVDHASSVQVARESLMRVLPQFDDCERQLEFVSRDPCPGDAAQGMPDTEAILENCLASERQATAAGYRGVRYAGTHECGLQGGIQGHNIKVLCMHPIVPAASVEARRVLTSHAGLFVKGGERWHRLIATNFREAKAVLAALGGRA